jgi:hypothetical protein
MPKKALTDVQWSDLKAEMRDIMIAAARMHTTIAYSELSMQLQTAYLHHRAPAFAALLREINDEEEAAGRPLLAVLVVNKQTRRCGAGFFKKMAADGYDVADFEAFWQQTFADVCDYWSEH